MRWLYFWGERGRRGGFAYVEDCGAVDHTFDWWHGCRTFFRQGLDLAAVGDVAFQNGDPGSEILQLMD